jgi:hypothetical protein
MSAIYDLIALPSLRDFGKTSAAFPGLTAFANLFRPSGPEIDPKSKRHSMFTISRSSGMRRNGSQSCHLAFQINALSHLF